MGSSARIFREGQPSRRKEISRLFERKRKTIAFMAVVFFIIKGEKMPERTSQVIRMGQLKGAKIKVKEVKNDGLHEYVTIINRGTVTQPMSGWVLASLRGQAFYPFTDDLMLEPGMVIKVQSGQLEPKAAQEEQGALKKLLWTIGQVWNNNGDTAILFDANGLEIDRLSYPNERVMGSSASRRKILIGGDGGFEIVNDSTPRSKKVTRK